VRTTLLIISFLTAQITLADTTGYTTAEATAKLDPARQSELLYFIKHDCGSCHGMTLKGGLGPALLPETLSAKPESYLVNTILEGRKNTAMPPWKSMLSQKDAIWITRQLQNGNMQQTELAHTKQSQAKQSLDIQGMGNQP